MSTEASKQQLADLVRAEWFYNGDGDKLCQSIWDWHEAGLARLRSGVTTLTDRVEEAREVASLRAESLARVTALCDEKPDEHWSGHMANGWISAMSAVRAAVGTTPEKTTSTEDEDGDLR